MATNTQNPTFPSFVFSKKTMEGYLSDVRGAVLDFINKYSKLERKHMLTEAQKNLERADFTSNLARSYSDGIMALSASVGWATCLPTRFNNF